MSEHEGAITTEVEIFGVPYLIRGAQEPEYLTELAAEVDRRMRELAGHVNNADPGRLAILAALNLADELSRNRRESNGERGEIEARVAQLVGKLDRVLTGERTGRKRPRAAAKEENRGIP